MASPPRDPDVLDRPADPARVRELVRHGWISPDDRDRALARLLPARAWLAWADRMLLMLGAALVLAGVIFFFAYNWEQFGKWMKFGLIGSGLAIAAGGAAYRPETLTGKILILSSAVLIGPLLAVYGQTYQTGADAYELFAAWALLMIPWVLAGRLAGLWVLWLLIVHLAVLFCLNQVLEPNHVVRFEIVYMGLAALGALFLGLREWGNRQGWDWLSGRWTRIFLLAGLLFFLSIPVLIFITDDWARTLAGGASVVVFLVGLGVHGYRYRRIIPDLFALALVVTALVTAALTLIGRLMFDISENGWMYLFFGLIVVGAASLATLWLRAAGRAMAEEAHD
jgi:uncharacterized membrane protein